jgi:UDP-N-acetylglucosamine:LPS N-acetylglucosamine transferase
MTASFPIEPDDARARPLRPQQGLAPTNGRIVIISASVGAGHDGPADELGRRLLSRGWWVDRPDGLRIPPARLGPTLRGLYVSGMRRTPVFWARLLDSCADGAAATATSMALDRLAARTAELIGEPPDAVVSTYPLVSQLLGRLRRSGALGSPVISYLTDPAVHPMWWHPGVDLVLAPDPSMTDQARRLARSSPGRTGIVETAPALPPALSAVRAGEDVASVRAELGVPPGRTLVLVTAGSAGTGRVHETAADLADLGAWPLVLCARNDRLRRRVEALRVGRALGWVDDVPRLLAAADVVVHNAGGLACWETLAVGRPVVSYRVLPGHGEANAAVLEAAGTVPWARTRNDLGALLEHLARPDGSAQRSGPSRPDPAEIIHRTAVAHLDRSLPGHVVEPVRPDDSARSL